MVGAVDHACRGRESGPFKDIQKAPDLLIEIGYQSEITGSRKPPLLVGAECRIMVPETRHALDPRVATIAIARLQFRRWQALFRVKVEILLRDHERHVRCDKA